MQISGIKESPGQPCVIVLDALPFRNKNWNRDISTVLIKLNNPYRHHGHRVSNMSAMMSAMEPSPWLVSGQNPASWDLKLFEFGCHQADDIRSICCVWVHVQPHGHVLNMVKWCQVTHVSCCTWEDHLTASAFPKLSTSGAALHLLCFNFP